MTYALLLRPEAEAEVEEAYRWYERQREGLGADFLLCVEEALENIRRAPKTYPIVHKQIHRLLIRRFPFGVFYLAEGQVIVVLAVFHAHRAPRQWQSRG